MEDVIGSDYSAFYLIIALGLIGLYIAITIAILKLPKIQRNTEATMKLTALMAKKHGVDPENIIETLKEADPELFTNNKRLENELSK